MSAASEAANCRCCDLPHQMPGDRVLTVKGLSYAYPNSFPALEQVNLAVRRLTHVAVIGPNGGGKSTLLKLILGIYKPSAGDILVFGTPPHRACTHVGYVPQHADIRPDFPVTVKEVVLMGCISDHAFGWHGRACQASADQALQELELLPLRHRPFGKLSGGERQRVLIARALVGHPQLLLLDEPTANVDPASQQRFRAIIANLSQRMTVVTVSHDLNVITDAIDQVIFVNRTAHTYQPAEIRAANVWNLYRDAPTFVEDDRRGQHA